MLIYRPDFIPARLARGVALYEQGKQQESEKDFKEALKFDNFGKELARLNLALIDLNANEVGRARKSLEEMVKMYPSFSDPHYHLSYLDYEDGRYTQALNHINKAIELETTVQYHKAKARILEKMPGQRVALEKTYRTLLQDFPALEDEDRKDIRQKLARLSSGESRTSSPMEMPIRMSAFDLETRPKSPSSYSCRSAIDTLTGAFNVSLSSAAYLRARLST